MDLATLAHRPWSGARHPERGGDPRSRVTRRGRGTFAASAVRASLSPARQRNDRRQRTQPCEHELGGRCLEPCAQGLQHGIGGGTPQPSGTTKRPGASSRIARSAHAATSPPRTASSFQGDSSTSTASIASAASSWVRVTFGGPICRRRARPRARTHRRRLAARSRRRAPPRRPRARGQDLAQGRQPHATEPDHRRSVARAGPAVCVRRADLARSRGSEARQPSALAALAVARRRGDRARVVQSQPSRLDRRGAGLGLRERPPGPGATRAVRATRELGAGVLSRVNETSETPSPVIFIGELRCGGG
jgi:hypothetical protein